MIVFGRFNLVDIAMILIIILLFFWLGIRLVGGV